MTTARASTRGARATRAVARATNARGTGVGTARRGRPRKEIARGDADGVRELLATIEVRFPEVVASGGGGRDAGRRRDEGDEARRRRGRRGGERGDGRGDARGGGGATDVDGGVEGG